MLNLNLLFIFASVPYCSSYPLSPNKFLKQVLSSSKSDAFPVEKSWQTDLDKFLDIDASCDNRRETSLNILRQAPEILSDISKAVQNRNVEILAPPSLSYGKALRGLKAFQKQLTSDIIPEILNKGFPTITTQNSELFQNALEKAPKTISKVVEQVREISQDPSMLQSTVDSARREVKNVFKSTPDGLESPAYTVEKSTEAYEIRNYAPYSVCKVALSGDSVDSSMSSGLSFNVLAGYIFGENLSEQQMDMTTPVITQDGKDYTKTLIYV